MKYFFIISAFLISSVLPLKVEAGGAGGGATEPTQWLNNAELIGLNISDAATAFATQGSWVKDYILNPAANALISSALQSSSDSILTWVSGGFESDQPLVISDPESYIKNSGMKVVDNALRSIPGDSVYGASIFSSLYSTYQGQNADFATQMKALSSSAGPSIIQNNLCTDQKITSLVVSAIRNSDGSYDQNDLASKKAELWDYACASSAEDPQTSARLIDLNKQNPSIGGWSMWLSTTGGDNDYTRSVQGQNLLANKVADDKEKQINEIYNGAGPVSEKSCQEFTPNSDTAQIANCIRWITTTPGDQVGESLTEALTSGMKRLENIMGDGSLTGLLQGFATAAISNGIKSALNRVVDKDGNAPYKLPITLSSSRPKVDDLAGAGNVEAKKETTRPLNKHLQYYSTALDNITKLNDQYTSDLNAYSAKITALKNCTQAADFFTNRTARINAARAGVQAEQDKIEEARALIARTDRAITVSNSSEEISDIFTAYLDEIEERKLPDLQTEAKRIKEYTQNKNDVENDSELTNWQTICPQQTTIPGTQQDTSNGNDTGGGEGVDAESGGTLDI